MINLNEPYDVYIATEIRQISNGGVSKWVDDWVENVAPYLVTKPILIIEIENEDGWINFTKQFVDVIHRPGASWEWEWTISQLPISNYFSLPDRRTVDMVIKGARKLHLLSYPLPILMEGNKENKTPKQMRKTYNRDIDSVCVHSRESETLKYQQKLMNFDKKALKYQRNSIKFQNLLIKESEESIWIGIEDDTDFEHKIPNYYEFKYNLPAKKSNIVGYPARCEPRKNIHFLENIKSVLFTRQDNFEDLLKKYKKSFKLNNYRIEDYRTDKIEDFFLSEEWGISHSCFTNEPFGYSIFQSIDFGKIPILSKDWCSEMDYPFRASTQKQFEIQYAKICRLSIEERNSYLEKLRDYLSKYSSKEKWRDDLLKIYNEDGENVWLPTSISPSKDV